MNKFIILLPFILMACAPSSHQTFLSDGTKGYRIDCSGEAANMGGCMEKAGQICGVAGYKVIDNGAPVASGNVQNQNNVNVSIPQPGILALASYLNNSGNQRYMLIKCNKSEE